jgi:hypothetical protein
MIKDCPKCRLANPPSAQRCDCGYDFTSGTMQESYLGGKDVRGRESLSGGELVLCVLVPVVGLILGFVARSRGRRDAGNRMLLISGVLLALGVGVRLILLATGP